MENKAKEQSLLNVVWEWYKKDIHIVLCANGVTIKSFREIFSKAGTPIQRADWYCRKYFFKVVNRDEFPIK